jgi:hypothetical protein
MSTNVPVTTWRPTSGNGEYVGSGVDYIVDQLGVFLIDPIGVFIVSPTTTFVPVPATTWSEDDSE